MTSRSTVTGVHTWSQVPHQLLRTPSNQQYTNHLTTIVKIIIIHRTQFRLVKMATTTLRKWLGAFMSSTHGAMLRMRSTSTRWCSTFALPTYTTSTVPHAAIYIIRTCMKVCNTLNCTTRSNNGTGGTNLCNNNRYKILICLRLRNFQLTRWIRVPRKQLLTRRAVRIRIESRKFLKAVSKS